MFYAGVPDGDLASGHGRQTDKRADFDHIRQHPVFGAAKVFNSLYCDQIASYAADPRAHPGQHFTKLLDIGFAGGVVDSSGSLGHYGCHDDVGGTGDGWFIQQQVTAFQMWGFEVEKAFFGLVVELDTQLFKTDDMGIEPSPAYLIAAGFGDKGFPVACQHRTGDHDRTPEASAVVAIGFAAQVIDVYGIGLEHAGVPRLPVYLYAHFAQQVDEQIDVKDIGDIGDRYFFGSKQYGIDDL